MPITIAAGGLIVLSMAWAGFRLLHSPAVPQQPAPVTSDTPAPHVALPAPVAAPQNTLASMPAPLAVLHQEIPEASRSARQSIRGRISVTIRVVVDRSGNVIHESVEYPGSSRYFARLGLDASKKWKFASANSQEPRVWLLRFEFTRSGTTGYAAPRS
jgi:outer membrane biosynthesis protein TonB